MSDPHTGLSPNTVDQLPRVRTSAMDNQHMVIFQAFLRLEESLRGHAPLDNLGARLNQLETMVLNHFSDEEAAMAAAGYPHLWLHRVEHEKLLEKCTELVREFSQPGAPPLTGFSGALVQMFLHHVQVVDFDYDEFMNRTRDLPFAPDGALETMTVPPAPETCLES
jgi:hemerythrin-like metal-binding protein